MAGKINVPSVGIKIGAVLGVCAFAVVSLLLLFGGCGSNSASTWQVLQPVRGDVSIRTQPGYYMKNFATVWTYPKSMQIEFKGEGGENPKPDDKSIKITFNDGGVAYISTLVQVNLPLEDDKRKVLHETFGGDLDGIRKAVHAHLSNCAKASAPLMSSTQHQTALKAWYTNMIHQQMVDGLYEMKQVNRIIDSDGEEIVEDATKADVEDKVEDGIAESHIGTRERSFATEIIMENNHPKIAQPSPLSKFGITILQFSILDTDYDKETLEKFRTKKDSFLKAEQARAERSQEVQQRLMIIEKGFREKAEVEAEANKAKATAVINAERQREVAQIEGEQKVLIAKQDKLEAETRSQKLVAMAKLEEEEAIILARAAVKRAEAIKTMALANEEQIQRGGAVTEKERVLAEIQARRDVEVAANLSKVVGPSTMIIGGSSDGENKTTVMENLINMWLLKQFDVDTSGRLAMQHGKKLDVQTADVTAVATKKD